MGLRTGSKMEFNHRSCSRAKIKADGHLKYTPRAWVFPIERRDEDVGYLTIDARQDVKPVLAYGKSRAPQRGLGDAIRQTQNTEYSIHERYLYHGGVEYGVETVNQKGIVDLRGSNGKKPIRRFAALEDVEKTLPIDTQQGSDGRTTKEGGRSPDLDGTEYDESYRVTDRISTNSGYGVPNWTETDAGGSNYTDIGTGADSWNKWDGCSPIAGSMAIGYHELITENEDEERESLIDRLHYDMGTDDSGYSDPWDIDDGISNYSEGTYSYNGNNNWTLIAGNVKDAIGNDNPPILSMINGPYTKKEGWIDGHSVTPVAYEDNFWLFYHIVHNGYDDPPDHIVNGNWSKAVVTRISKE